jgi:hypothetical protein
MRSTPNQGDDSKKHETDCPVVGGCGNIKYIAQQISADVDDSKNAFSYLSGDTVIRMKLLLHLHYFYILHLDSTDAKSNYFTTLTLFLMQSK